MSVSLRFCARYTGLLKPPGGGSAYERGGDTRRKFWIKPLKETDLGVAQAFLTPKRDHVKTRTILYFYIFSRTTLNKTFPAPKRDDEHPHPFHMRSPPTWLKPFGIRLLFTHKTVFSARFSKQNEVAPILKVGRHISDRFLPLFVAMNRYSDRCGSNK